MCDSTWSDGGSIGSVCCPFTRARRASKRCGEHVRSAVFAQAARDRGERAAGSCDVVDNEHATPDQTAGHGDARPLTTACRIFAGLWRIAPGGDRSDAPANAEQWSAIRDLSIAAKTVKLVLTGNDRH